MNENKIEKESVWDYPRPPKLEKINNHLKVVYKGTVVAETKNGYRVLETSHPPVYYFPPEDVKMDFLFNSTKTSFCEWKGEAKYYNIEVSGKRAENSAWYYPNPAKEFQPIKKHIAIYPQQMEDCFVDGEKVTSQDGEFYGGWITKNLKGPFKGGVGTLGW
jgi:uncharacterized protein (DUF427 family)